MQAILLDEVEGLGTAGTVVNVARGYMRNYLEPRGLAEAATPGRIAEIRRREEQRAAAERKAAIRAVGTYSVPVELAPGLATEVKTIVSPLMD